MENQKEKERAVEREGSKMRAAEAVGLAQSTKRTLFLHIESDSDTPPAPASLFEGVRGNVGDEARAVIARGIVCTLTKKSTDFEMLTSAYPEIGEPGKSS